MITVAYLQTSPLLGKNSKTLDLTNIMLKGVLHADLIVLPELANSGYNFISKEQAVASAEDPSGSSFVEMLMKHARRLNANLVSGFNELAGDGLYNSALLVNKEGVAGCYRKTHLFMHERDFFLPGNEAPLVYDLGFVKLGMQICFDYMFPEFWQHMAMQGAQLIAHPSNLVTHYAWKVVPALALMNRIYVVTANRIGAENNLSFRGRSFLAHPDGAVKFKAPAKEAVASVFSIDPSIAMDKRVTLLNHVFNDRRTDLYDQLL